MVISHVSAKAHQFGLLDEPGLVDPNNSSPENIPVAILFQVDLCAGTVTVATVQTLLGLSPALPEPFATSFFSSSCSVLSSCRSFLCDLLYLGQERPDSSLLPSVTCQGSKPAHHKPTGHHFARHRFLAARLALRAIWTPSYSNVLRGHRFLWEL